MFFDGLQFVSNEEGRFRYIAPGTVYGTTYSAHFAHDYFIKDHLGNIRTVITNERRMDYYPAATMEERNATVEDQLYSNLDTRSDLPEGYPASDASNQKVAKVGGGGSKMGPAILLKVMAGDYLDIFANSWYAASSGTTAAPPEPITDLASLLANEIQKITLGEVGAKQLLNSSSFNTEINQFLSKQQNFTTAPRAFLNWILFDERFNIVQSSSGSQDVPYDPAKFVSSTGDPIVYNHVSPGLGIGTKIN